MGKSMARLDDGADPGVRSPAGHPGLRSTLDPQRLLPILSIVETWAFGFTGLILWLFAVSGVNADLGPHALLMWVPLTAVGILVNLQVLRLGSRWSEMSGGTPNYTSGNLSASRVVAVAGRLEEMGREGDLAAAEAARAELEDEVTRLGLALDDFREGGAA